jgi:hypothetical protein
MTTVSDRRQTLRDCYYSDRETVEQCDRCADRVIALARSERERQSLYALQRVQRRGWLARQDEDERITRDRNNRWP